MRSCSTKGLSRRLGESVGRMSFLSNTIDDQYSSFNLGRKGGGARPIDVPKPALMRVQKRIHERLLSPIAYPLWVQGSTVGRSPHTNASEHLHQTVVVRIDVREFFPSVNSRWVYSVWSTLHYTPDAARLLTRLTTCKGRLPQGAPTSPALANLALASIDAQVSRICRAKSVRFTRFVDDMVFSGGNARAVIGAVCEALTGAGLRVSRRKLDVMHSYERQVVTGYTVNRSSEPSLSRSHRERVRAAIHQFGQASDCAGQTSELRSLRGRVEFVRLTNAGSAKRLAAQLQRAVDTRSSR
jgi:hypothetical protein